MQLAQDQRDPNFPLKDHRDRAGTYRRGHYLAGVEGGLSWIGLHRLRSTAKPISFVHTFQMIRSRRTYPSIPSSGSRTSS
jgi:hypothetical protein